MKKSLNYTILGHKILNGQKRVEIEKGQVVEVKMSVQYMSFSAHADAKGQFLVELDKQIDLFIAKKHISDTCYKNKL